MPMQPMGMMGGAMRGNADDVEMMDEREEQKIDMRGKPNMHLGGLMQKLPGQREMEVMESYR